MKRIVVRLSITNYISNKRRNRIQQIRYNSEDYIFAIPNELCKWRVKTFSSKEPETLAWIDSFKPESIFWDIGANIGLYSVYAAKKGHEVYSFDPSVFNLEVLARNSNLNNLNDQIHIVPVALSDKTGFGKMNMSNTEVGGALSTFDKPYGSDGDDLNISFSYNVAGLTIDDAIYKLRIPVPTHVKLDVDGIEHLILAGGVKAFGEVQTVLVEVSQSFGKQQKEIKDFLTNYGFHLKGYSKEEKGLFNISYDQTTINQIWRRK